VVTTEFALNCRGLTKNFGALRALDGFDIDLMSGQVLALLGPSGCGKTTALRIIAGFEAPDEGSVLIGGKTVAGPGISVPPEKRRVGMVFQDFALFPHLNVAANLAFGLPKSADKKRRVGELLELVGMPGLESRMPHELSGGQQQRIALARALGAEPELILLDEPFSNLDPWIRSRVRNEVKELIQAVGITAVFVTHDQEEALSIAGQVGVMMAGRLLQVGTPSEIYTSPATREVGEFVGGANFLAGRIDNGVVQCELGRLPVKAGFTGAADVMVRAESLAVTESGGAPAVITNVEYFGHDQLVTARLPSGVEVNVRLLAAPFVQPGQRVSLGVKGDVLAFPARGD
jgi:iron(III) transport system ATP-binding protein